MKSLRMSLNAPLLITLSSFLLLTACADEPEVVVNKKVTGLEVMLHFDTELQLGQFKVSGWLSNQEEAFTPAAKIPEEPKLITGTEQSFVLLLPDSLAGQTIRLDVEGYSQGIAVAAGSSEALVQLRQLVKVDLVVENSQLCEADLDNDNICDGEDPCIDLDQDGFGSVQNQTGCQFQGLDLDDTDPRICADTDNDECDDCSRGPWNPRSDGADGDGDGICDVSDACTDSDQDGFGNGNLNNADCEQDITDVDDHDYWACADTDSDECDDCANGLWDPANDGSDLDSDGICDVGDTCTDSDGDGVGVTALNREGCTSPSVVDSDDSNQTICADTDSDGCDDCVSGGFAPTNDGIDRDVDGLCDAGDTCIDVDNDGVGNGTLDNAGCSTPLVDSNDLVPTMCADTDHDACDDCSSGTFATNNDGTDSDSDGLCDLGDGCTDADGDGLGTGALNNATCDIVTVDSNDQDAYRCTDSDFDGCDDCAISGRFTPDNDGTDTDNDGQCDVADNCVDLDGDGLGNGTADNLGCASSVTDIDDNNQNLCADTDNDGCDDCSTGTFNPSGDGDDRDSDGICNQTDTCTDADRDGLGDPDYNLSGCAYTYGDTNDNNPNICTDSDNDSCDDCSVGGLFAPGNDGTDTDFDGSCDEGDTCTDQDQDGVGRAGFDNSGCATTSITDSDDENTGRCADTDADGPQCDDCASGAFAPNNDGADWDLDGKCNAGDTCTDQDGDGFGVASLDYSGCLYNFAADDRDNGANANRDCTDSDSDGCDDCSQGDYNPELDGADTDSDGVCNITDTCTDFDQDGIGNGTLNNSGCLNPMVDSNDNTDTVCGDTDNDLCDDCSSGTWDPLNDGEDTDHDGQCNVSDTCPDNDEDGICATDDCDDFNEYCQTNCTDADNDNYCADFDCDETYPTCNVDCITNSDSTSEPDNLQVVDCIEIYCGSDPYVGSSRCFIPDSAGDISSAINESDNGETFVLVGNVDVGSNLSDMNGNGEVTITQQPGTSITVDNGRLFRVRGSNKTFKDLVIKVERADSVFDIRGDNNTIDGVTIISMEKDEPKQAITISEGNNTVQNSQILGFQERGITIKGNDADNNTVFNNIITGGTDSPQLEKAGVMIESGSGNEIVGNVIVDNEVSGIMLRKAQNTMIAHNTIANNFNAITFTCNNNWEYESWKSTNTCARNNTITGNNAGVSQSWTYTTWDTSSNCAVESNGSNYYGNNSFENTANCYATDPSHCPSNNFWEYNTAPNYVNTTRQANQTAPVGYYCLGQTSLKNGARDLGYDRNGDQSGNYNGTQPDVGGREAGTPACE